MNAIPVFITPRGNQFVVPKALAEAIVRTKDGREDMRYKSSREVWAWAEAQEAKLMEKVAA